jgi:hypothetical protein
MNNSEHTEIEHRAGACCADRGIIDDDFELPCTCGLPLSDPRHQAQHQIVLADSRRAVICPICKQPKEAACSDHLRNDQ